MQTSIDYEIDELADAARLLKALESGGGWLSARVLRGRTGLCDRTIRKLVVEQLRPRGVRVLSCGKGYKLAETDEEVAEFRRFMLRRTATGVDNLASVLGLGRNEALNEIRRYWIANELSEKR